MTKEFKNILEEISSSQMARLKKEYEPLRKIDMSKHKGQIEKTTAMLSKMKMGTLIDLSKEDIPVISDVAKSLVLKDKRFAHHVESVNEAHKEKNPHQDGNTLSPGENKDINIQRQNQLNKKAALATKFAQIERGRKAIAVADPITYKMDADNSATMPYTPYKSKAANYAANVKPKYYFKKEQLEEVELDEFTISDVQRMAKKGMISKPTPEQMK